MIERYERTSDSGDKPRERMNTIPLRGGSVPCAACGKAAALWTYAVRTTDDGSLVIDGWSLCEAHRAAA